MQRGIAGQELDGLIGFIECALVIALFEQRAAGIENADRLLRVGIAGVGEGGLIWIAWNAVD